MTDSEFMRWLYKRLEFVHEEDPSAEFMARVRDIQDRLRRYESFPTLMEMARK